MSLVPASVQSFFKPVPVTVGPITRESLPRNPQFLRAVGDYYEIDPSLQGEALIAKLPWDKKPRDPKLALKLVQMPYTAFRDKAFAEATLQFLREDYFRFRPDEKTKRVKVDPTKCFGKKKTVVVESVIDKIEKNWRVDEDLLANSSFAEVYKKVFGIDVADLVANDQLYRWNNLLKGIFGVAKWAVKNAYPLFAASAIAYAAVPPAVSSGQGITSYVSTHYSMGILLLGLLPLFGMRQALSPVFLRTVQGLSSAVSRVFKAAKDPLDAITAMFKNEQPHYFLAKFLGFDGAVKKYVTTALKHGGDGVKLELEKDFEKPYGWWDALNKTLEFRKKAKSETSALGLSKLYTGFQHALFMSPSGRAQTVGRTIESIGALAWVVSLGIVLNQGKLDPAFIASLAASAGMGAVAATVANNHVENTGKFNKALAKIYQQSFSFGFALAAIVSVQDTNSGLLAYGLKTLLAVPLVIGATNYILPKGKKAEEKAAEPRLTA